MFQWGICLKSITSEADADVKASVAKAAAAACLYSSRSAATIRSWTYASMIATYCIRLRAFVDQLKADHIVTHNFYFRI